MSKIASDGSVKAAQRAEGVTAALAIALIAGADVKADKSLESFWALFKAPSAALLSTATLARLPATEAAYAAELAEVLLLQVSHFCSMQISSIRTFDELLPLFRTFSIAIIEPMDVCRMGTA